MRCLAVFDADPAYNMASGHSVFRDGWQEQFHQCIGLGARYVLYSHGLEASRRWAQELSSSGIPGSWLAGFLGGGRQAQLVSEGASGLQLMGTCVPSRCAKRSEVSVGWHVLLKKLAPDAWHDASRASLRPPGRGRIRLRMSRREDAARAHQLILLLESLKGGAPFPSWYLNPSSWQLRPNRAAFVARSATQDYFRREWSVFTYRLHLNHQHRYGLCSIPKVGLLQFFLLNCRLSGQNATYEDVLEPGVLLNRHLRGLLSQVYWKRREWKLAVFVRDPLERFLSAFVDKCLQLSKNCPEVHRHGWEDVSQKSPLADQIRAFRTFASQALPTPVMLKEDHWIPQSLYLSHGCSFIWQRLDFVGLLTSDRPAVNWQVFESRQLSAIVLLG